MSTRRNVDAPLTKPVILALGRQTWRAGQERHEIWTSERSIRDPELWFVWGGHGSIRTPERTVHLHAGMALLVLPEILYDVVQNPKDPLSINYFEFRTPEVLPEQDLCVLEHADFSLYDGMSRRILELYWESFAEHGWQPGPDSPAVYFQEEEEYVRTGAFCPNPIRMFPPAHVEQEPATRLARQLFRALLADFLHRMEHQSLRPDMLGIEARHRNLVMDIAARLRTRPHLFNSIQEVARDAGYSTDHFSRLFHRTMGCSPKTYLLNCRIDLAKHLLLESPYSIKEIADQLGYSAPGFFSRQFKNVTGFAPIDFREENKRDHG